VRVISCQVKNFGSYKDLEFSFDEKGLCLIHGATGSGKSTLCDVVPWVLFGQTAKGGAVNDIIRWGSDDIKGITEGTVHLDTISVCRSRNPNDLYFFEYKNYADAAPIRGKDLNDTQRLINARLGIDVDLYLSGAYFHEFSRTAAFFTATAKARREICEQIVDLSLADKLKLSLSAKTKDLEKSMSDIQKKMAEKLANDEALLRMKAQAKQQYLAWEKAQKIKIDTLLDKTFNFDSDRDLKISTLMAERDALLKKRAAEALQTKRGVCPTCGGVIKKTAAPAETTTPYDRQIAQLQHMTNVYEDQLREMVDAPNPHKDTETSATKELSAVRNQLAELTAKEESSKFEMLQAETLQAVVLDFRGVLIKRTIQDIEDSTNNYLTKHFDSEIQVQLTISSSDKVDTTIRKGAYECVYTQLSKGQRQLLKLCFGLAVMGAVSNHHGVQFSTVFLDEAFDGLDEQFKMKAFNLLQTIALKYENVFVVEHSSELKSLFTNQYEVRLINGSSVINA